MKNTTNMMFLTILLSLGWGWATGLIPCRAGHPAELGAFSPAPPISPCNSGHLIKNIFILKHMHSNIPIIEWVSKTCDHI